MKLEIFVGGLLVGSSLGRPLEQNNEEELDILSDSRKPLATLKHARSDQKQKRQFLFPKSPLGLTTALVGILGPNAPLRQDIGAANSPTPWGTYSEVQPADISQAQYQSNPAAPLDEQPGVGWESSSNGAMPNQQEASPLTSEAQPVAWDSNSSGAAPNQEAQPVVNWDSASVVSPAPAKPETHAESTATSAATPSSLSLAPAPGFSPSPMSFSPFSPRPMTFSTFSPRPVASDPPPSPPSPSPSPASPPPPPPPPPPSSSAAPPKATVVPSPPVAAPAKSAAAPSPKASAKASGKASAKATTTPESAVSAKESRDTAHTVTDSTGSTSSTSSTTTSSASAKGPPKGFPKAPKMGGGGFPKLPGQSRSITPPGASRPATTSSSRGLTGLATPPARPSPKSPSPKSPSRATPSAAAGTAAQGPAHSALPTSGSAAAWDRHAKTHSFQIILSGTPDIKPNAVSVTPNVDVYDVDLFMTDKATITTLKRLNKTVICYFSGGTYEPGRPDSRKFANTDMGYRLLEWPSEKWLKLNSTGVRRIMADRIQLAREKGCDAIDPDNVDGFQATGAGGLSLKKNDAVNFVRFLSETAEKYGMATGLKNAMDLIRDIRPYVHFAVNEQCADKRECKQYATFQKPVFHIEYPRSDREMAKGVSATVRQRYCVDTDTSINRFFHTAIKPKELNGIVQYCDGKLWKTPTKDAKGGRSRSGWFESHDPAAENEAESEAASPKDWQNDPEMIALQEELARQDGYPYGPGKGSESLVSDADLLKSYDRAETWGHS